MIRKTHNFLQWAFAIFVLYLLITRLFISWLQFFPANFSSVLNAVSGYSIQFDEFKVEQNWLGFELQADNLKIDSVNFEFQASKLKVDLNTFYYFLPSVDYGDYLIIKDGFYQVKNTGESNNDDVANISVSDLLTVDASLNRFWKRVELQSLVLSEIRPGLSVQLHDFQSLKSSRLTVTSEFSLSYKDVLNYERFNLKSSFSPDVWGNIEEGVFSLSSFKPLGAQKVARLLLPKWQEVLPNGELILDLDGEVTDSQLANMRLAINSQSLKWKQVAEGLPESLGLLLEWKREKQNIARNLLDWQFNLSKIQIDNSFIESVSPIQMNFEGGSQLKFRADKFNLEPFKVIVKALVRKDLASDIFDRAVNLKISNFSGNLNWQTLELPSLNIDFDRLDLPVTDYPGMSLRHFGIRKVDGKIMVSAKEPLWVLSPHISPKPMRIELPERFGLAFDSVNNSWSMPKINLSLNKLPVGLEVAQISDRYVDTSFNVGFVSMEQLKSYLPYSMMTEKLQAWLKTGLIEGRKINLSGELRGLYENFPFDNNNGRLQLRATVKDAVLNFNSKWPKLTKFDANILFTPYQLDIDVAKLPIGAGNVAENVRVSILDLNKKDIALTVTGNVDSSFSRVINYLSVSPIAEKVGIQKFLKANTEYKGKAKVRLDQVWIPISGYENADISVKGQVNLSNAGLKVLDVFEFEKIYGNLSFTESSISSKKFTFETLKGQGQLTLTTDAKTKAVQLSANGQALQKNNDWFEKPVAWKTELVIPFKKSQKTGINLSSTFDLNRAKSKLPAPLDLAGFKDRGLKLNAQIGTDQIVTHFDLENLVKVKLSWKQQTAGYQLNKAQALIGAAAYRQLGFEKEGSYLRGKVDQLDLNDWIETYKKLPEFSVSKSKSNLNWKRSELNVEALEYLSNQYKDIKASWLTKESEPLVLHVVNDQIDANIKFRKDDQVDLNVNRFNMSTGTNLNDLSSKEESGACLPSTNTELMPVVNFNGKNIVIDGRLINSLNFIVQDKKDSLALRPINGSFGNGAGDLTGEYIFDKTKELSYLKAELKSKKVEAVAQFIKADKGFTGKSADVDLNLAWAGSLQCFNSKNVKGNMSFNLKDGSIEDVEPGIARLIGLLSVDSLVRRLKLDLKDVTNKGMVYDSIKGRAVIKDSMITLQKMDLRAPSADGELKGTIDIDKQLFNLKAELTPKVGSTLPTIAALAGSANPLAALAVYTVMKVIPGINENLVTYQYTVTGPWENPKIKEKGGSKEEAYKGQVNDILDIQ